MATGKAFEVLVKRSAQTQALELWQNTPSISIRGRDRDGRAIGFANTGGRLDFEGWFRGTTWFSFDAKSSKGQSLPLRCLRKNQVVAVRKSAERGRLAFFLVQMTEAPRGPRHYALLWPTLRPFWDKFMAWGEPASIPLSVLERDCLEVAFDGRHLDLAGALEQLLEVA